MHLVVGATGALGSEICRLLRAQGAPVRALVRQSSSPERVDALRAMGAGIVVGDLKDAASVRAALGGVTTVFSTATALASQQPDDSFEKVDRDGQVALIDAAKAAGVQRFVFVSVLALEPTFAFASSKHAVEAHLQASGVPYTILQPSCFMDVWLTPHVGFDAANATAAIYGDGDTEMAWVHSRDVARIAVAAAVDPSARNAIVPVVGPERLTQRQVVQQFEAIGGRTFTLNPIPRSALEGQLAGATHPVEQAFAGLMLRAAVGDPPVTAPPLVRTHATTTVAAFARESLGPSGAHA
jgi:NADH dehydrogenase